jgi:hypothetical protein
MEEDRRTWKKGKNSKLVKREKISERVEAMGWVLRCHVQHGKGGANAKKNTRLQTSPNSEGGRKPKRQIQATVANGHRLPWVKKQRHTPELHIRTPKRTSKIVKEGPSI